MDAAPRLEASGALLPYESLFQHSPNPKIVVDDKSLTVVATNAAAQRVYGYSRDEMRGLAIDAIWPSAERVFARRDAGPWIPNLLAWIHRHKNGAALDVMMGFQDLVVGSRRATALHITEIGERAFSMALMEGHSEILELIARGTPLKEVLGRLVATMERLAPSMTGSVLLLEGNRMRHGAAPHLPAEYLRAIDGLLIGPSVGSCGTAMFTGEPVVVTDVSTDPLWKDFRELALRHELRACWSAPILSRTEKVLGAFAMYYHKPRAPDIRDRRIVHLATQLASIAIERDLSDRAIVESEGRLRAILDHASAVVYVKDLSGRHVLINRQFEQTSGFAAAAVLGKTDQEIFPCEQAEALSANDGKVAQTGAPISVEEELTLAVGWRVFLSTKFPLLDASGKAYAVCGISTDITERKRAEHDLQASREELRALSQQLQHVREEERARISREIHDELGQLLTGLNMNQGIVLGDLRAHEPQNAQAIEQLESMQQLVRRLIGSVRRIATELRPEVLDALGIAAALEWQATDFTQRTGIACEVRLAEPSLQLDPARSTALFRIFQEALSNIAQHSGATRAIAQLRCSADAVVLVIADNGRGMLDEGKRDGPALGLLGMRERAAKLGGAVSIESLPRRGCTVTVRLPL